MQAFRKWLATKLARLAQRIHPTNNEVMSFYADRMVEMAITGQSWIKVSAVEPDANCITTPDGGCVGGLAAGNEPCMHDVKP